MKSYEVEVRQIDVYLYTVEASSSEEARKKAWDEHNICVENNTLDCQDSDVEIQVDGCS